MSAERLTGDNIEIYRFNETETDFSAVCTVCYDGDSAFIKGYLGRADLSSMKGFKAHLVRMGVKRVSFVRHGKLRGKKV